MLSIYCKTSLGVDPSARASPFVVTLLRMCCVMSLPDVTEQDSDMSNDTERLISSPSDPNFDDTERLISSFLHPPPKTKFGGRLR